MRLIVKEAAILKNYREKSNMHKKTKDYSTSLNDSAVPLVTTAVLFSMRSVLRLCNTPTVLQLK